jgi:putative membrane protein
MNKILIALSSVLLAAGCAQRADMGGADYDNNFSTGPNAGASVTTRSESDVSLSSGPAAATSKGAGARALTAPDAVLEDPNAPATTITTAPAQLDTSTGSAEYRNQNDTTSKGAGARALTDDQTRKQEITPVVTANGAITDTEASRATSKGAGARALIGENVAQGGEADSSRIETRTSTSENSSTELNSQDANFVREAAAAGLAEVRMGQLAQQNAQNQSLKDFGSRIVADHTKANQELMQIASQKGIQTPTAMNSRDEQMIQHLSSLNGAEFDKACDKHAVEAHVKAVKAFKTEADRGQDPELKAFAQKTLPTLEEHLKMARDLNGSKESKEISIQGSSQQ